MDSTTSPRGTIQNPNTGRKPTNPQRTSTIPINIRNGRDWGTGIV
jgi:hypothetical protein